TLRFRRFHTFSSSSFLLLSIRFAPIFLLTISLRFLSLLLLLPLLLLFLLFSLQFFRCFRLHFNENVPRRKFFVVFLPIALEIVLIGVPPTVLDLRDVMSDKNCEKGN